MVFGQQMGRIALQTFAITKVIVGFGHSQRLIVINYRSVITLGKFIFA